MAEIDFPTPIVFGALCHGSLKLPQGLGHALSKRVKNAVLLPFQIEQRHLKNVITCMQLMDIAGLVVTGRLCRAITRHLKHLDPSAKKTGSVDVIVRQKRKPVRSANRGSRSPVYDLVGFNSKAAGISPVDLLTASK